MINAKNTYALILDSETGTDESDVFHVEGDYLLLLSGDTIGTVNILASSDEDGVFVSLDEAEFTEETGKNISLPRCFIKASYNTSTNLSLEFLPFRRD